MFRQGMLPAAPGEGEFEDPVPVTPAPGDEEVPAHHGAAVLGQPGRGGEVGGPHPASLS